MRLVKPVLFIIARESASVDFSARLFADGFPQPLEISATLNVVIDSVETTVEDLVPDVKTRIAEKPLTQSITNYTVHT